MNTPHAILAIHDVTPRWEDEITSIYETILRIAADCRPALLVIPNYHGQWPLADHTALVDHTAFVDRIKTWIADGSEPILHGWTHLARRPIPLRRAPLTWALSKTLTAGEGEFLDLSQTDVAKRSAAGKALLEQLLSSPVRGFVPPAWLRNRFLFEALASLDMRFTEGHLFIYDLKKRNRRFMPAVTFSGRTPQRAAASVLWARGIERAKLRQFDIRLALHPGDWRDAALRKAIEALIAAVSRTHSWARYADLLG